MSARRAARELALFTMLQSDRLTTGADLTQAVSSAMIAAVRLLIREAESQLESGAAVLQQTLAWLQETEWDHPDNLTTPINAPVVAVPLAKTDAVREAVAQCLKAADWVHAALRVPLLKAHLQNPDVMQYAQQVVMAVRKHTADVDARINQCADDWKVERLFQLDAAILRLSVAEITYLEGVDPGVSINEAVELAKTYSSEDSYRFINGVLGQVALRLNEPLPPAMQPAVASSQRLPMVDKAAKLAVEPETDDTEVVTLPVHATTIALPDTYRHDDAASHYAPTMEPAEAHETYTPEDVTLSAVAGVAAASFYPVSGY